MHQGAADHGSAVCLDMDLCVYSGETRCLWERGGGGGWGFMGKNCIGMEEGGFGRSRMGHIQMGVCAPVYWEAVCSLVCNLCG